MTRQKYIVAMSGGVDSSLTALLLKEAGHQVTGVCMAVYDTTRTPSGLIQGSGCYDCDHSKDQALAKQVCNDLGIDFYLFDCVQEFKQFVLSYFQSEYKAGRTPNPCVRCNEMMKFGVLNTMATSKGIEFDYFATGHYAQVEFNTNSNAFLLKKGKDTKKDQSYFLYRLTQEKLRKIKFPLGEFTKQEVRNKALQHNLIVFDKPDSQDFYSGQYADLLDLEPKNGFIVLDSGKRIGTHKGFWNYTIGQRKGLGIAFPEPLFVIDLDPEKNEVIVAVESKTYAHKCIVESLTWTVSKPELNTVYTAKIRSTHKGAQAVVTKIDETQMTVEFLTPQKALTAGQSLVLYANDCVLGGGVIRTNFI